MIVKNEEENMERCLSSIYDIVDEIIIVDTGSTDKTVDIARNFGAKIYYFKWNNNFSEARNESLKYATKDWILILDGDDEFYKEDRETLKVLLDCNLDEKAIYYFETLSYYGSSIQNDDIAININPRLFKNNRGIHYKGEVHNQLIFTQGEYNAICDSIKIHHYGYLDKMIISKDKRNRNISILKEQIKNNLNNGFAYFNLGNEYSSLNDTTNALECYYKSYEDFDSGRGYSFILILRLIISNYNLKEYNEALKFIDIGIKYYPKCTDVYFYKALICKAIDCPTLQIKALEKCIEMGEPPSELKFIYGTGSFKAYYELGNVYMKYKDYDTAYNYYIEAMSLKPDYIEPIYKIAHILKQQNLPLEEFKIIIEKFFTENHKASRSIVADLFYDVGYYKTALEYIKEYTEIGIPTENMIILKTKCLIRSGEFEKYINLNDLDEKSSNYVSFSMYKVLCGILLSKYDYSLSVINRFKEENLSDYDKKKFKVYSELVKLFKKGSPKILSVDENEKEYMSIILEILEILLINDKLDEFKITVNLLNSVDNKFALLYLGKLYYKYGYIDVAKKEILRSIKEFDIYDNDALDILRR
jgi:glycosyltransferase involved in cell wall biosynthesis